METKYQRSTAIKATIQEINNGTYKEQNEEEPNFLLTISRKKLSRVNIIGIIIQKEKTGSITSMIIDDSSGNIILRSFEELKFIEKINVGDHVIIIGKIRTYNNQIYISPEICKIISPLWLQHRIKELPQPIKENKEKNIPTNNTLQKETKKEEIEEDTLLPINKMIKIIKELDQGEGVSIEEILEKSTLNDSEKIIERMLESGDIFQNMPGKVKVL
jgi:RPA family protein